MIKGLKDLFIYKKPDENQERFRFPEPSEESERWDQYDENNSENNQQGKQVQKTSRLKEPITVEQMMKTRLRAVQ